MFNLKPQMTDKKQTEQNEKLKSQKNQQILSLKAVKVSKPKILHWLNGFLLEVERLMLVTDEVGLPCCTSKIVEHPVNNPHTY